MMSSKEQSWRGDVSMSRYDPETEVGGGRGGKAVRIEADRRNCYDADTKKR